MAGNGLRLRISGAKSARKLSFSGCKTPLTNAAESERRVVALTPVHPQWR
jgi:hypothetical protein